MEKNMSKRTKFVYLLLLGFCAILGTTNTSADSGFWGGADTSTGGSPGDSSLKGWYYGGAYAWYKYDFESSEPLGNDEVIGTDPWLTKENSRVARNEQVGPTNVARATIAKDCPRFGESFYLSGYILYNNGPEWPGTRRELLGISNAEGSKYRDYYSSYSYRSAIQQYDSYYGLYLGLGLPDNSNYYLNNGQLGNLDVRKRDDGVYVVRGTNNRTTPLPNGVKNVSVISREEAKKAFDTMKNAGMIPSGQSPEFYEFKNYTWFCGGEKAAEKEAEAYYDGHAKIRIMATDDSGTSYDKSVTSDDANGSSTITIKGDADKLSVKYRGYGYASIAKDKNIADGVESYDRSNFTLTTGYGIEAGDENKRVVEDGSILLGYDAYSIPELVDGKFDLALGESKTICTRNDYHTHYYFSPKNGGNGWTNEMDRATACYTVNYERKTKPAGINLGSVSQVAVLSDNQYYTAMSIEAETLSKVSGSNFGSELTNRGLVLSSRIYPSTLEANVKPGYYKYGVINRITKEGIINGDDKTVGLGNAVSVVNPSNSSNCSELAVGANYVDCYNDGTVNKEGFIYPGETQELRARTEHPVTVGDAEYANSGTESSEAKLQITGLPIECSDFANTEIGVNNPVNYGRIEINASNKTWQGTRFAGDSVMYGMLSPTYTPYNEVWLSGKSNKLEFNYYGCMGHQIANDSANNSVTDQYTVTQNVIGQPRGSSISNYINSLYSGSKALIGLKTPYGMNIGADELGDVRTRIDSGYQFSAVSSVYSNLSKLSGSHIENKFSWPNGRYGGTSEAQINVNVPFNYYLTSRINSGSFSSSSNGIFAGSSVTFTVGVDRNPRANSMIMDLPEGEEFASSKIKKTTRTTAPVYVSSSIPASEIEQLDNLAVDGNMTGDALGDFLRSRFGYSNVKVDLGAVHSLTAPIESDTAYVSQATMLNTSESISFTDTENSRVGDKLCAVIAIYPADSHNTGDGSPITSSDQTVAINGPDYYGDNAKTSITMSCVTVGKKPTVSVEGGSVAVKGSVNGYNTVFDNKIYGSWAEYDLVASGGHEFSSGAASAYTNPQSARNVVADGGVSVDNIATPQSLGNLAGGTSFGADDEARAFNSMSWSFADNLRGRLDAISGDADVEVLSDLNSLYASGIQENKFYVVKYESAMPLLIDRDLINTTKESVVIIFSKSGINITPNVERIDATLISTKRYTTEIMESVIDTCYDAAGELEQGASNGNYRLLEECSKTLTINGEVLTDAIKLDRANGGGSIGSDGELHATDLVVRAESFNYDPRIVRWSYRLSKRHDITKPSYTTEITPRL